MHYAVLFMSEKPCSDFAMNSVLEKYWEGLKVEKYMVLTKEQAIEEGKRCVEYMIASFQKQLAANPVESVRAIIEKNLAKLSGRHYRPFYYRMVASGKDPELIDGDGNIYSTYNPQSKYDWYCVGGRFKDLLKTKDGQETDEGFADELSFDRDPEAYRNALRFWEVFVEGKPLQKGERKPFSICTPEYFVKFYKDKETYADLTSRPIFRAVVTPDGEWHEKGEVGWFSTSETPEESLSWDLTFTEKFIRPAIEKNLYMTVLDCHI